MVDDPWMPALAYGEKDNRLLAPVQLANDACGPKGFVASTLMVARNVRVPYNMAQPSCSGDTFYGVPYVGNSQLFVHKKSRTAPQKWENLWNDTGYFLRSGPGNPIVTDFMPMLWARSTDSFQLDTSEGLQLLVDAMPALDDLRRLGARERLNLSITSYDDLDLAIHMVRGSATASIVWSAWAMAMDTHARGQLEFTGLPEEGTPELGVWLLTIPANSNRRKDAQKFLDFATTYDALLTAARHGNPPPRTDVLESQTYRELVSFSDKQLESLSKARPRPRTRYWKQVETVLGRCLSNIYESPEADANRILENANAGIKKVLGSSDEFARNDVVDGFTCQ
jgi:multiple sugar transport system substrate-binding protein